jgi:hypothetical protein
VDRSSAPLGTPSPSSACFISDSGPIKNKFEIVCVRFDPCAIYAAMQAMLFGAIPAFTEILDGLVQLEHTINGQDA